MSLRCRDPDSCSGWASWRACRAGGQIDREDSHGGSPPRASRRRSCASAVTWQPLPPAATVAHARRAHPNRNRVRTRYFWVPTRSSRSPHATRGVPPARKEAERRGRPSGRPPATDPGSAAPSPECSPRWPLAPLAGDATADPLPPKPPRTLVWPRPPPAACPVSGTARAAAAAAAAYHASPSRRSPPPRPHPGSNKDKALH